jgi:uncharacterized protein YbjT (DUF2867 family)
MVVVAEGPAAGRVAMVAGATGLVGREVLAALLADERYRAVHALGRRPLAARHPKLSSHTVDFARLQALPALDDVYIALGTTIKVAGSRQAFRAVDFEAVVAIARCARKAGATRLGVVSAMGASAQSPVFYNRVKGEMELALRQLGFETLVIARPSMLDGDRAALAQPPRMGERIGLAVMGVLKPLIPANYRAIAASRVAERLVGAVRDGAPGQHVLLSGQMQ